MKNNNFDTVVENLDFIFSKFIDRPALFIDKKEISYKVLRQKVDEVLNVFLKKGFKNGDLCIIFNDKSLIGISSIIACIYLGVVFVNLDEDSPVDRLDKIISKSKPRFLINLCFDKEKAEKLTNKFNLKFIEEEDLNSQINKKVDYENNVSANSPLYVMFTSGSTGFPKGAIINHKNLLNFIYWAKKRFKIDEFDRFTNINPIYFDNSIFDLFASLLSGACLVPFKKDVVNKPLDLLKLVHNSKCTIWFSVPSLLVYLLSLRILDKKYLTKIRSIIFGGEGFPKKHLRELFKIVGEDIILENVYGPTECTCICSSHQIVESDFVDMNKFAPLGKLANHFSYKIDPLNSTNKNIGELILIGPSVGQGYINDSQISQKSFIKKINNKKIGFYGYRTGDIVEVDEKGYFNFISRKDYQIKNMGYRIELGEIESAANNLFGVFECAAIFKKIDNGISIIILYLSGDLSVNEKNITEKLNLQLPKYMMPKLIKILKKLPKNSNGKIDRKILTDFKI